MSRDANAEMSGRSAQTSRKASEHVRSAAAASSELSQSIVEISRRVQEAVDLGAALGSGAAAA